MNTVLGFMDKLYGDSTALTVVYIVCSILLFAFIILLIFSLRKPKEDKKINIIEEPNIDDKTVNDKTVKIDEVPVKTNEFEKNVKVEENEEDKKGIADILNKTLEKENVEENKLSDILNKVEKPSEKIVDEEIKTIEEDDEIEMPAICKEIPDVDDFVNNVVNKTYEKNEQFSSVYVGDNTSTIKLEKVLDKMNVDEDIKEEIIPEEEKIENKKQEEPKEEGREEKSSKLDNLDALKKSLEEKKKNVTEKQNTNDKQEELKAKLDLLKNNTSSKINLDDLASKLKKD